MTAANRNYMDNFLDWLETTTPEERLAAGRKTGKLVMKMDPTVRVLSDITLSAVQAEATRAHLLHGENSMLSGGSDANDRRYRILGEEFGEVGRELNDAETGERPPDRDKLVKELLQVAAMALSWVEALEGGQWR